MKTTDREKAGLQKHLGPNYGTVRTKGEEKLMLEKHQDPN